MDESIIEKFDMSNGFVKIALVFLVGIMILGGFVSAVSSANPKSVGITLSKLPKDGDIIQLGSHVFEFDSGDGVASDNIPVEIGATLIETKENFVNVVSSNTDFSVA